MNKTWEQRIKEPQMRKVHIRGNVGVADIKDNWTTVLVDMHGTNGGQYKVSQLTEKGLVVV